MARLLLLALALASGSTASAADKRREAAVAMKVALDGDKATVTVVMGVKKYAYYPALTDRRENGTLSVTRVAGGKVRLAGVYHYGGMLFVIDETLKPGDPVLLEGAATAKSRWEALLEGEGLTAKQRTAYEQIAKLHTVTLDQGDWGSISIPSLVADSKLPTDVLYRMGMDILPMLAEALDDETPTATVTVAREGTFKHEKVWKVNEFAALLIIRIADRDFVIGEFPKELGIRDIAQQPKSAPEFRKLVVAWHGAFAAKTPTERKIADVADAWFRNRFDAIIWLGGTRAKEGLAPIAARVDTFYADPKRESSSLTRTEMSYCALSLGQIGGRASLPPVRQVCADVSHTVYMCYRPSDQGRWGAGSGINEDLFRAYRGLALLGEKDEAVKELKRLLDAYGAEMEAGTRRDYEKRLTEAKDW